MQYLCNVCREDILKHGFPCLQIYQSILKLHVNNCFLVYNEKKYGTNSLRSVIRYLELKEFIVTTEFTKNFSLVKINFNKLFFHQDQEKFCRCKSKDHFESFKRYELS